MKTKIFIRIISPLVLLACLAACNGTTITTKTYRTDGSLESESVSETSETSLSTISRAFAENSKEKFRLVWLDASKFSFGCSSIDASLGVDYFEANGGYISMPMSAQNAIGAEELKAVSKIASSTKFTGALAYGDFKVSSNSTEDENSRGGETSQTPQEKE